VPKKAEGGICLGREKIEQKKEGEEKKQGAVWKPPSLQKNQRELRGTIDGEWEIQGQKKRVRKQEGMGAIGRGKTCATKCQGIRQQKAEKKDALENERKTGNPFTLPLYRKETDLKVSLTKNRPARKGERESEENRRLGR